jgi:hypothetical protein
MGGKAHTRTEELRLNETRNRAEQKRKHPEPHQPSIGIILILSPVSVVDLRRAPMHLAGIDFHACAPAICLAAALPVDLNYHRLTSDLVDSWFATLQEESAAETATLRARDMRRLASNHLQPMVSSMTLFLLTYQTFKLALRGCDEAGLSPPIHGQLAQ